MIIKGMNHIKNIFFLRIVFDLDKEIVQQLKI